MRWRVVVKKWLICDKMKKCAAAAARRAIGV